MPHLFSFSHRNKVLDFVLTDGVRYDTGPDGGFYHALVTHVREADKGGNIITYRQEPDGQLIRTGVIENVDPQVTAPRTQLISLDTRIGSCPAGVLPTSKFCFACRDRSAH